MTALCRYLDPDGRTRLALYNTTNSTTPTVCPISQWIGDEQEILLANSNHIFAWTDQQFEPFIVKDSAEWQPAPEQFLPPVGAPEKIICIGLNYLDHAIETGAEPPDQPIVFSKFNNTLVGHRGDIVLPRLSTQVDYEAELVVVIGQTARHVEPNDAMRHVFGYTAGHDVSSRDYQKGRPGGQWLLGKSFETFAPIGPAIVTARTFGDASNVRVRMHVNDETVQDSTTAQLIFGIPFLVSHLSRFMTLRPGDLIFTGTPPGVGAAKTPPRFLQPGDRCTVEIDGIGKLTNVCVAETR